MSNYPDILVELAWRALFAVPPAGLGWYLCATAQGGWANAPRLLFGMACFVAAAIVLGPSLARLFAEPTGSLFYPGEHFDRPQPMYSIAEARRKEGRHTEALAAFEKIAADYPGEVRPYIEMIDIAVVELGDGELAKSFLQKGFLALKRQADRDELSAMYRAIVSRLPGAAGEPRGPIRVRKDAPAETDRSDA